MNIWRVLSDYSWVIFLMIIIWVLGIWIGSKFGKVKILYLKNPFKGKSSAIKDESISEREVMRYKREYVINLIMASDKDIDYEAISDFTVYVEDLVESGKIDKLKELEYKVNGNVENNKEDRQMEENDNSDVQNNPADHLSNETEENSDVELILNNEEIEYFLPNEYIRE